MEQNKSKKLLTILTVVGIYLLSTGISYAVFDYLKKPAEIVSSKINPNLPKEEGLLLDNSGPKTETCPINGSLYTKAEKDAWSTRRPLLVMIENHEEARPQSGLSKADVVYEAVAEGGITRFMAVFYCDAQVKETIVGPVRSARTYFLDWTSEYGGNPLYAHVGGANCAPGSGEGCLNGAKADALGQIDDYGWEGTNDLNQFSIGYPTFWRDYERIGHTVATEHTMYSTTERLWAVGKKRGFTDKDPKGEEWTVNFTPWVFKEEAKEGERKDIAAVSFNFWENYDKYAVQWNYDKATNTYLRTNGGQAHSDLNTKQQLAVKNVVIQFQKESPANDGYAGNAHLLYGTIGEGNALFFQDGQVIMGKWVKNSRLNRTKFFNQQGKEVKFNAGKIWIETLPTGTKVNY